MRAAAEHPETGGPGAPEGADPTSPRAAEAGVPLRVWGAVAVGLLAFGSSAVLVRLAGDAPGLTVAAWRTLLAAVLVAPAALWRSRAEWRALAGRDLLAMGAAGVVLGFHFVAYIESVYHTSVASASVLVTSSPVFIAILGYAVLRERLRPRTIAAIAVALAGSALIGLGDGTDGTFPRAAFGNALALGAAFLAAVYLLIGRSVRQRVTLRIYLGPLYATAAAVACAMAWARGLLVVPEPAVLALCLAMALGPQVIGHGAFNYAVRYVPAAVLGLLTLAEPVLASALAVALFGEVPGGLALAGMGLVLASIAVVVIQNARRARPTPTLGAD